MKAAIVAGGLGTRMRSVSEAVPKFMLPIGGKPLLEHQLEWLKAAGFADVYLCLGHKAETVKAHFEDGARLGMTLRYQVERFPRGTAGCVADLGSQAKDDLLVVYGDVYPAMDLKKLLDFHAARQADAVLVVMPTDHPYDSDLVSTRGEKITGFFRPRPGDQFENLAAAAIWVVRPALLELVPKDKPSDFGRDVFPEALRQGRALLAYQTAEKVEDVGTPERREAFLKRWEAKAK